jgi:hypothetical protein
MNDLKSSLCSLVFFVVLLFNVGNIQAQVLVHEEPRHKPVFQNNQIRILNVLLPPGDTTQYHIHHTPSVFIFFTATTISSQLQGSIASTSKSIPGNVIFENLASPNLRVHRVWNIDKDTLHVIDVELLSKDTGFVQKPMVIPELKLTIDTPWVRAYRFTLSNKNDFTIRNKKRSLILVSLTTALVQTKEGGKAQNQALEPGSFFEIKGQHSFSLKNSSDTAAEFVLLEVPGE